jgi:nicotinate dehydrogenase subunit B
VAKKILGAALLNVDESSVNGILGFLKIIRHDNFLAVIAETEWAAIKASQQLKANWSAWAVLPGESHLWEDVRATKVAKEDIASNVGNTPSALARASRRLKATYDFATQTCGSIGPSCRSYGFPTRETDLLDRLTSDPQSPQTVSSNVGHTCRRPALHIH